jgi:hypothetical protein
MDTTAISEQRTKQRFFAKQESLLALSGQARGDDKAAERAAMAEHQRTLRSHYEPSLRLRSPRSTGFRRLAGDKPAQGYRRDTWRPCCAIPACALLGRVFAVNLAIELARCLT